MLKKKQLVRLVVVVLLLPVIVLALFSFMSKAPTNLGVQDGQLAPCPDSPNCVCSQETDEMHGMEAIPFEGEPSEALAQIKKILASQPRTKLVEESKDYLHAEAVSLIFRFVDDVEFYVDQNARVIHFRSASRVGRSDLGVNRKRMETIRREFLSSQDQ